MGLSITLDVSRSAVPWQEIRRIDAVRLVQLLLLAAGYLLAALVSYPLTDLPILIASIWLPSGVAVMMVMREGYRMLPVVMVCNTIADMAFGGFPLITALGIGVISAGECALATALLRDRWGGGFRFDIPAIVRFAIAGMVVAPATAALAAAGWLTLVGAIEPAEIVGLWRNWTVSAAMGILLIVPLLESWRVHGPPRFQGEKSEAASVLLVFVLLSVGVFVYELADQDALLPVLYSTLFLMIWCALYFRETGATTSFAVAILAGCAANAFWAAEPVPAWVIGVYAVPFALVAMILAAAQTRLEQAADARAREQILERLAYQDALTGLANRAEFERHLEQATQAAHEHGTPVAVVFIDLDGFKPINDTHGHAVGDEVLIAVGHRLRQAVRTGDLVARVGGDEFTAVLSGLREEEVAQFMDRLARIFEKPLHLGGRQIHIEASLGFSLYPDHATTAAELVREADFAMYRDKHVADRAARTGSSRTTARPARRS